MSDNALKHDSARLHVTGEAVYVNDMVVSPRQLVGRVVYSPYAHARILSIDYSQALKTEGCMAVITAKDIPGKNQMGPVVHDEPCLAENEVNCIGQAVLLIAATGEAAAFEASKRVNIIYEELEAITDLEQSMDLGLEITPPRRIECGDVDKALAAAPHVLEGRLCTGAQEHWYLETQTALAVPGEAGTMKIFASSQNPSETQAIVAEVLGKGKNEVEVEVPRMGGGFGGKETQGNHVAAWAALLSGATGCPVLIHLFRDDDQIMTGKRHRYISDYKVGFDDEGRILAWSVTLNSDAGCATDLSRAILERSILHAENAYYIPNARITGRAFKTNLPSNTAFRGFGGPQGIAVIENAVDRIARFLGKDAAGIRKLNFYGIGKNHVTPYGQAIEHNRLPVIYDMLMESSGYIARKAETDAFNRQNEFVKRGIALTPVKFGISFTTAFLNQAGALVNIYNDGTVTVNHGGTEMGQGLQTKILAIAAAELGISPQFIKVAPANTSKVPNTSATAASSGSDLNGMAVKDAIGRLRERLAAVAVGEFMKHHGISRCTPDQVIFSDDKISLPNHPYIFLTFPALVKAAYLSQVSLSATGFYRTPGISFDREKGQGHPFCYYAYSMAVSEVEVDVLTGVTSLLATHIVHDTGDSLHENIDIGQIEGAFIQGVGWCITEEIKWDSKGRLLTHSPDTYKIPTVNEVPGILDVQLLKGYPQPGTIRQSKAVGEPPFMLAFSVWLAAKYAISAVGNHRVEPIFSLPATAETVLMSIEEIKGRMQAL